MLPSSGRESELRPGGVERKIHGAGIQRVRVRDWTPPMQHPSRLPVAQAHGPQLPLRSIALSFGALNPQHNLRCLHQ